MTERISQSTLTAKINSICDIMRRANATSSLQYIPELTWLLFLRIFDEREQSEQEKSEAVGKPLTETISSPYRWRDWAAPNGEKRKKLQEKSGNMLRFVANTLLPHLRGLKDAPNATAKQKIISEMLENVQQTRLDSERNFSDVIDKVDEIHNDSIDTQHTFPLSQAYESLLLKLGEKNNDGGQFFTPREVVRAVVQVVKPKIGETIYDPACGTGGFLIEAYEQILKNDLSADEITKLKTETIYGRDKEDLIYPIALANMILHGIDEPHIWHGNTLTDTGNMTNYFSSAPELFDVVLMNPPFGGKEGTDAQKRFAYQTTSTQVLFLQEIMDALMPNGRAGIVVDEGLLFRINKAFVKTKRKLLDEFDLYCIVSLPAGVFTQTGAGVKTNLLFFNKGGKTAQIWYYDLSHIHVTKGKPLTLAHFDHFFELLPHRTESENSWIVKRADIEAKNYDISAKNPNRKIKTDARTPTELLETIANCAKAIEQALAAHR